MTGTPTSQTMGPADRITLDDLKHRAEAVRDLAVAETRGAVRRVLSQDSTKGLLVAAGLIVAAVSIAYLAGTRAGARRRVVT